MPLVARQYAAVSTLALMALSLGGCGKLLGKKDAVDADSGALVTPSPATEDTTGATTAEPAASAAPSSSAAVGHALAIHGRGPNGCLPGFVQLGPPGSSTVFPCYKPCAADRECTGGETCQSEEAFGRGSIKVCDAAPSAKKAMAIPSPTTDRFGRNRLKDGPCPARFTEEPGVEDHSWCARVCKSNSDCHGHLCDDSDVGNGKVCKDEKAPAAAAAKCKGSEIPAGPNGECVKQCMTNQECGTGGTCAPTSFTDPSAGLVNTHVCIGGTPAPATPAAAGAYKVGDKLTVEWKGATYPATVIAVPAAGQYKIHYDGYESSWDEVVGAARIRGKR